MSVSVEHESMKLRIAHIRIDDGRRAETENRSDIHNHSALLLALEVRQESSGEMNRPTNVDVNFLIELVELKALHVERPLHACVVD